MMNLNRKIVAVGFILLAINCMAQKANQLKPTKWITTQIPEPSDLCFDSKSGNFFVVSDDGILFETDKEGKIIRKVKENDADFEAVHVDENNVYAVNERHRKIYVYNRVSLQKTKTITVPFGGGRNRAYEALTFNKEKNTFILVVEKDPITLLELDVNFNIINEIDLSKIARDIAAASFHNGFLWLLSDEDSTVLKLNPTSYEVIEKWKLPVINPEELAFDNDGNLVITCDDMQRIYYFNNPENK
ncbi:MAG: SdiA-regulated domain-containing protein [Flavobacterium sp.]|nr:SdiA-regulated domain-containing protein [Flavobacterium sp.]